MNVSDTIHTAPAAQPLSLAEAKEQLRLDVATTAEDDLLNDLIAAAADMIEGMTWRALITQTRNLKFDRFPSEIVIGRGPVSSIEQITYVDTAGVTQTLASAAYQADLNSTPARICPAYGYTWPATRPQTLQAVEVRYIAGYGASGSDVPQRLRNAMKVTVHDWYENRMGEGDVSDVVRHLVASYRIPV